MTFLQAAEAVLRSSKRPLTATEITAEALKQGLLQTKGKTPLASMNAALYRAPLDAPIRREFIPGPQRAQWNTVRWRYVRPGSR